MIEMFEKHQHKEQFLKDMSQKQEINRFSEVSQKITRRHEPHRDLRTLREFSETSMSWLQCFFRIRGSFIAVTGENLKYSRSPTTLQKINYDFTSFLGRIEVEDQNMVSLQNRWCSTRRARCLRKQEKANMAAIQRYFRGGTTKKNTESYWRSAILTKRKSCVSIASLLKDTTIQLRELSGCRTPKIGFFVWMLMGLNSFFDRDQNLPLHWHEAKNARRSLDGNATISETDTSRTSTTSTTRSTSAEEEKTSITMSIARLDDGTTESHGETRQQRLHLHHRSGKTHSGRRVGVHGIPHHLIYGSDFGFLEGIPENRWGSVDRTPTHKTHLCSTISSQSRTAQLIRLAEDLHCYLCAPKKVSSGVTHVSSMVVLSRAFLQEHFFLFIFLPYHTTRTLSTSRTFQAASFDKLRYQESLWREDLHCRVAETRAQQLPHNEYAAGIDGEPIEFEWNIFSGFTAIGLSERSRKIWVSV